jgi:ABC-2 type transport system permease protein
MIVLLNQIKLETKLFLREKGDIFWALAFPIFMMVLYGLIYRNILWDGRTPMEYLTPGIVVMAVMITCIMNTAIGFVADRAKGIFRRLSLTPLKREVLIGGQLISRYIVVLVQTIILIAIGVLFFDISIQGSYLIMWVVLTIGAFSFLTTGFSLTTFLKSEKSALPVALAVLFILMFLGGSFFPIDILPESIRPVCRFLPSAPVIDALRKVAIERGGFSDIWIELLKMGGWIAVTSAISVKFFKWE